MAATEPKQRTQTRYHVLEEKREAGEAIYKPVAPNVEASSAQTAIKRFVTGLTAGGTFVAVPVKSFQPVKVKIETQTVVKLE